MPDVLVFAKGVVHPTLLAVLSRLVVLLAAAAALQKLALQTFLSSSGIRQLLGAKAVTEALVSKLLDAARPRAKMA